MGERDHKWLKSKITHLKRKISDFKPFFNLWYEKNIKRAYFCLCIDDKIHLIYSFHLFWL